MVQKIAKNIKKGLGRKEKNNILTHYRLTALNLRPIRMACVSFVLADTDASLKSNDYLGRPFWPNLPYFRRKVRLPANR